MFIYKKVATRPRVVHGQRQNIFSAGLKSLADLKAVNGAFPKGITVCTGRADEGSRCAWLLRACLEQVFRPLSKSDCDRVEQFLRNEYTVVQIGLKPSKDGTRENRDDWYVKNICPEGAEGQVPVRVGVEANETDTRVIIRELLDLLEDENFLVDLNVDKRDTLLEAPTKTMHRQSNWPVVARNYSQVDKSDPAALQVFVEARVQEWKTFCDAIEEWLPTIPPVSITSFFVAITATGILRQVTTLKPAEAFNAEPQTRELLAAVTPGGKPTKPWAKVIKQVLSLPPIQASKAPVTFKAESSETSDRPELKRSKTVGKAVVGSEN